jgi:hypothetical protein
VRLKVNEKWKKNIWKEKQKYHDKKVGDVVKYPEKYDKKGGKVVFVEEFPRNSFKDEIGDVILVRKKNDIFFITVFEITFGNQKKMQWDLEKLQKSKKYFRDRRNALFFLRQKGVFPNEKSVIVVSGKVLWYYTQFFYEKPHEIKDFEIKSV